MSGELAAVFYGLFSAAAFGTADFSGGLASKRASPISVVITSQVVGLALMLALAVLLDPAFPPLAHLLLGGVGGIVGALALLGFYRVLATGRMGVAAPLTAVTTGALPVLVGVFTYGLPGALKLAGFALALLGIWLISQTEGDAGRLSARDIAGPLIVGLGFGVFFVIIDQVNDIAVFWPLAAARLASLTLLLLTTRARNETPFAGRALLPLVAVVGVLDALGNATYALAALSGRIDIAAVLASLYPAATVGLAAVVLREPISRIQGIGIFAALAAVILIAL
jgi:drug/metabolite transporter (DMT)-like permease